MAQDDEVMLVIYIIFIQDPGFILRQRTLLTTSSIVPPYKGESDVVSIWLQLYKHQKKSSGLIDLESSVG